MIQKKVPLTEKQRYTLFSDWDIEPYPELTLIYLTYDNTKDLKPGDEVEVTIEGAIAESFPMQAVATSITKK